MSDSNELIQQQKNEKIEQLKKELADLGEMKQTNKRQKWRSLRLLRK